MQALGSIPEDLVKGTIRFNYRKKRGGHPDNSIIKIGQNTEESARDLRRLAVTQIPVKDHQLTLMLKTHKV